MEGSPKQRQIISPSMSSNSRKVSSPPQTPSRKQHRRRRAEFQYDQGQYSSYVMTPLDQRGLQVWAPLYWEEQDDQERDMILASGGRSRTTTAGSGDDVRHAFWQATSAGNSSTEAAHSSRSPTQIRRRM